MVGNGWHIGSVGSWLMYVLAVVVFAPKVWVPRPLWSEPKRQCDNESDAKHDKKRKKVWGPGILHHVVATIVHDPNSEHACLDKSDEIIMNVIDLTDA